MQIIKSYKFRIYPSKDQCFAIDKEFGCSRFVYNYFLNLKKQEYLSAGKNLSGFTMIKMLPSLKKEFVWLKKATAQSLQASVEHLDLAYTKFFKKQVGFPIFKSKKSNQKSYKLKQGIKIISNKIIQLPKLGKVIFKQDRLFTGKIISGSLSKNPANQYYLSLAVEEECIVSNKVTIKKAVGIDVGVKTLAVCSDGKIYPNKKLHKQFERKLKLKQRKLAKKLTGSKRRELARVQVAKVHLKVSNKRKDYLQKITTKIVSENQAIVLEDLAVKNLMKNHKLAREIAGCSWSSFVSMLEYKSRWKNKLILKVDRWFPSSKTCFRCGFINRNLKLSDRIFNCPSCQFKIDRDLNASYNILKQGINDLKQTTVGLTECDEQGGSKNSYLIDGVNYLLDLELLPMNC